MGRVFQALDLQTDELVAVKLLILPPSPGGAASPRPPPRVTVRVEGAGKESAGEGLSGESIDLARFDREARLLASVPHPRIVRYVAHGAGAEGPPYLAMEWLEGESLAERIGRAPLRVDEALRVALRTAEGLAEAHRRGVIHRDVKPSNVFLVGGVAEGVKLLDFGIARRAAPPRHLTASGVIVGTPGYMAPEQVFGRRELTPRIDVWALGCVLYECLCGVAPFEAENDMGVLGRILSGPIPRARARRPDVPPAVDALLARMLEREVGDRVPDAAAVIAAISALEDPSDATRASALPPARFSDDERRVQCLVLISRAPAHAPALSTLSVAMGGRLRAAGQGALVASFAGRGTSRELAARGARFALAARALAADARFDVVLARTEADGGEPWATAVGPSAVLAPMGAPSGVIRVDRSAAAALDARFELREARDGLLLVGERSPAAVGSGVNRRGEIALVGRARELAGIEGALAECVDDSVARAVVVVGEAGMGKTRLCEEFLHRARETRPGLRVLGAQGDPLEAESPFGLAAALVRSACAVSPVASAEEQRQQLRRALVGAPPEDARRITDFLAELLDVGDPSAPGEAVSTARRDAVMMSDALRRAFADWLGLLCDAGPVVLVLEDVHWTSVATTRLVDVALRQLQERPLFVLATARPEVRERLPGLWSERGVHTVELTALTARPAEQIALGLLRDADCSVIERVVARAGGNPLFLVELARVCAKHGPEAELPDSLLGVIQLRYDVLGVGARRALRAASVFGARFWRGAVAALVGGEDGGLDAWLEEAVEAELITASVGSEIPGERGFSFKHALLRDAAYASLTGEDRTLAHRLAATFLEQVRWSNAAVVAQHYEQAGLPDRAVNWYRRGAQSALEGQALALAVDLCARGLACATEPGTRVALLLIEADAALLQGDLDRAVARATEATACSTPGDADWHVAAGAVVTTSGQRGDNATVEQWADREVAATTDHAGAAEARVVTLCRAVSQLLAAGRVTAAGRAVQAIEAAGSIEHFGPDSRAWVHRMRATVAMREQRYEVIVLEVEAALACYERIGDLRNTSLMRLILGSSCAVAGELERAEECVALAASGATRIGAEFLAHWGLYVRGKVHTERGELEAARDVLGRVIRLLPKSPRIVGGARVYLSAAAVRGGDAAGAEAEARAALTAHDTPTLRAAALAALARALAAQGRGAEAVAAADEAMELLERQGTVDEFEGLVRLARVEARIAVGDRSAAVASALATRDWLLDTASHIRDPARRDAFLTRRHLHARALELARELDP